MSDPQYLSQPQLAQQIKLPQQVQQAYSRVQNSILGVRQEVANILQKQEWEFMFVYRAHLARMQKELSDIKRKSEEQEKSFSVHDRIMYLQKQMAICRDELTKAYDKVDKTNKDVQTYKRKYEDISRMYNLSESTCRELMKQNKKQHATILKQQQQLNDYQNQQSNKWHQEEAQCVQQTHDPKMQTNICNKYLNSSMQISSKTRYRTSQSSSQLEVSSSMTKISSGKSGCNLEELLQDCLEQVGKSLYGKVGEIRETGKQRVLQLLLAKPEVDKYINTKLINHQANKDNQVNKDSQVNKQKRSFDKHMRTSTDFMLTKLKDRRRKLLVKLDANNSHY